MIHVCKQLCSGCPFSNTSTRGFLADYEVSDFSNFMNIEFMFPCHSYLESDLEAEEAHELVQSGELPLCRGYAESMIKSCKSPRNPEFRRLLQEIKPLISDNSMSIWEFTTHHSIFNK